MLAVHAFNNQPASSTDFGFNAQLYTYVADPSTVPPVVAAVMPASGCRVLPDATSRWPSAKPSPAWTPPTCWSTACRPRASAAPPTRPTPSASPSPPSARSPSPGRPATAFMDFDRPPKPFDGDGAPARPSATPCVNPNAPTVASQSPLAGATVNSLTQVTVSFTEAVTGVDAADLRINGVPAATLSGGTVQPTCSPSRSRPTARCPSAGRPITGITDTEPEQNAFDGTRAGQHLDLHAGGSDAAGDRLAEPAGRRAGDEPHADHGDLHASRSAG